MNLAQLVLVSVYAAVPLACWPMVSRIRVITVAIEVILSAAAVGVVLVATGWVYLPARLDLAVAYAPATVLGIATGLVIERRQLTEGGQRISPKRRTIGKALIACYLGVTLLCCTPVYAFIWNGEGWTPSSSERLPLPAGLTIISDKDEGCGSGACSRSITIGNRNGLTADQILTRVTEHLDHDRGWHFGPNGGSDCRRQGWLIDQTSLCVTVGLDDQQRVSVDLTGRRAQD